MTTLTPEQQHEIAQRFHDVSTRWSEAIHYRSNTRSRKHPVYQELISLGNRVIPLILEELKREPSVSWFTVPLRSPRRIRYRPPRRVGWTEWRRAWLDWGRQRGYAV